MLASMVRPADQHFYPPIPIRVRKEVIQAATEDYVRKENLDPGFTIEVLIKRLGGRIEYAEKIGTSISSESIHVFSDKDFIIFVPTDTSPLRDRFTIAHELGHYLIHFPKVQDTHGVGSGMVATRFVDENDKDLVRAEWEANWFAATLLMPEAAFREKWSEYDSNLVLVASYFNVTRPAAEVRAKSLSLLPPS
jgi:Zn-dependent peptidase ImmA (M78 family)